MIAIRHGTPADFGWIAELERDAFPAYPFDQQALERWTQRDGIALLVLEAEGERAGYLMGLSEPGVLRVISIAIDQRYRRAGFGRRLVESLVGIRATHRSIEIEVRAGDDVAHAFWTRLGFIAAGIIPLYYPDGGSAIRMLRRSGMPEQLDRSNPPGSDCGGQRRDAGRNNDRRAGHRGH